ncbi:MAG: NADH-quinone oxidoreductase subunit L [Nitrososphaeria archaeon]|nr:NADH-quinone oxidoreductase subunit L [Nitrososphaeria archaeon]MDW8043921.1 NADH-quinone oxidoreductase subunit L [Nitrososphaerota archaeon]
MLPYAPWLVWLIPILGSPLVPAFFRLGKRAGELYSISLVAASTAFAVSMVPDVYGKPAQVVEAPWLVLPGGTRIEFGVLLDPLSVLMAVIANGIGLLILIYSVGYMAHEEGLPRYWFFMTFFIGGMTLLVVSDSLAGIYIGWEIVGICSYGLISFYYHRKEARLAGIKAFVTTRIGDVMLFASIALLFSRFGTLSVSEIAHKVHAQGIDPGFMTLAMLLAFGGAMGKSAQFPLHVWLPDAMEGPTPVSALIHAATMVKAGVYLMARYSWTLVPVEHFGTAQLADWYALMITIGSFTSLFAATMGLVMNDIKRVVAYSTISQLALMFAAIGAGSVAGWASGVYHLLSHSAFKALLFLAAGSVIHAVATNDIDQMGGLRKHMPVTFYTALVGALSLSGVPPLSGFFTKDLVINSLIKGGHWVPLALVAAASVLTVVYSMRWISKVFLGEFRGHLPPHAHADGHGGLHESPKVMTVPLVILAALAAVLGLPPLEEEFLHYLGVEHVKVDPLAYVVSAFVLVSGFGVSYLFYLSGKMDPARVREGALRPVHRLLVNRYYIDQAFELVFVTGFIRLSSWVRRNLEERVIDGLNYSSAKAFVYFVQAFRYIQTGSSNVNVASIALGVLVLVIFLLGRVLGLF